MFVRQNSPPTQPRIIAYRLVGLQVMMVVFITLGWWMKGAIDALSVLLGGMASLLPSLFFAHRLFSTTSPRAVKQIMVNFYLGEVVKWGLTAVLVIVTIVYIPIFIIPFIMGFVGAQFGFWLAPFVKLDRV